MLSLITGGLSGLFVEGFKWFKERDQIKQDHKNEMERLFFMAQQQKESEGRKLEEIRDTNDSNAEIARFNTIQATAHEYGKASKWVDNLNGIVRPMWAFFCMFLVLTWDIGIYLMVKKGLIFSTDSTVALTVGLNIDLVMYVVAYYFVGRSIKAVK